MLKVAFQAPNRPFSLGPNFEIDIILGLVYLTLVNIPDLTSGTPPPPNIRQEGNSILSFIVIRCSLLGAWTQPV